MDVEPLQGVVPDFFQVRSVKEVEHAQVQEERVVRRACERLPTGDRVDRLVPQRRIVGHRCGTDVGRRDDPVTHEGRRTRPADLRQCVVLREVQRRVGQRRDGAGVVQEGLRVLVLVAENPPVDDVRLGVAVVVDVDVVTNARCERVEVRTGIGSLERDPVADERDALRVVWTDERVEVGCVDLRVGRCERRFPVTRCVTRDGTEPAERADHDPCRQRGRGDDPPASPLESVPSAAHWAASISALPSIRASAGFGSAFDRDPLHRPGECGRTAVGSATNKKRRSEGGRRSPRGKRIVVRRSVIYRTAATES